MTRDDDLADLREEFRAHVAALAGALAAALAADPSGLDDDTRRRLIREAHILKGSAATIGFPEMGPVGAELERLAKAAQPDWAGIGQRVRVLASLAAASEDVRAAS
jgi:HPt (histidine-containing phosphotransfer) domain-containing protein